MLDIPHVLMQLGHDLFEGGSFTQRNASGVA
jgi:hypothetical protein